MAAVKKERGPVMIVMRGTLYQYLARSYRLAQKQELEPVAKRLGLAPGQVELMELGYTPIDPIFLAPIMEALKLKAGGFMDRLRTVEMALLNQQGIQTREQLPLDEKYVLVRRGALDAILGEALK